MKYPYQAIKYSAGLGTLALSQFALAAPDAEAITAAINDTNATIDSVGMAMITLFVGIMVFGVIIGMVARKGR